MDSDREKKIDEFVAITGVSREIADSLLKICNDNLEMAINMQMEGVEVNETAASSSGGNNLQPSNGANFDQPGTSSSLEASEEVDEDGVRAPIPQKQEVLIQPGYEGYALNRNASQGRSSRVRSVFDGFRNFSNEARNYEQNGSTSRRGKKRTLEELFKPPLDIMFKGDFQTARDSATSAKKWLMINIQDACEFPCQVLNRDVWSNEAVKTILREHFIFWQQYKESEEAQRYVTFYPITEWPYVAILDPRTGELMVTWKKIDGTTFCDLVTEFLSLHPNLEPSSQSESNENSQSGSETGPEPKKAKTETEEESSNDQRSILDADEDDQLAAAIQASLKESEKQQEKARKAENSDSSSDEEEDDGDFFEASFSAETSNSGISTSATAKTHKDSNKVEENGDSWESYLGDEDDPKSSIMIRFPDGKREKKEIPCSSQFRAIVEFVKFKGFKLDDHEIITNFPRRILTDLDSSRTLKELGLFPKEMIFVQQK